MLSVFCFHCGTKLAYGFVLFNYLKVQLELNGWGLYMEPKPLPVLARVLPSGAVLLRDKRNSANMVDIPVEIGDFTKGFRGK